jgi:hypothetical protein
MKWNSDFGESGPDGPRRIWQNRQETLRWVSLTLNFNVWLLRLSHLFSHLFPRPSHLFPRPTCSPPVPPVRSTFCATLRCREPGAWESQIARDG